MPAEATLSTCRRPGAPSSCSSTASATTCSCAAAGHAPFLRSHLPDPPGHGGFPSTTATSMGTFGTGLRAGAHGLVGYEVLVPGADRLLNELSWEDGPDPFALAAPRDGVRGGRTAAGVDGDHGWPRASSTGRG